MSTVMLPETQFPSKKFTEDLIRPLRTYFAPKVLGLETVETGRPALYVGNHTVFGLTDGIFLGVEMYLQKDIQLRTLVDELHMEVPFWRDMVTKLGIPIFHMACYGLDGNAEKDTSYFGSAATAARALRHYWFPN
jgi:hypothetical protein